MSILTEIKEHLHNNYAHCDVVSILAGIDTSVILSLTPQQLALLVGNIYKSENELFLKYN